MPGAGRAEECGRHGNAEDDDERDAGQDGLLPQAGRELEHPPHVLPPPPEWPIPKDEKDAVVTASCKALMEI
jgi:hypothetical protein